MEMDPSSMKREIAPKTRGSGGLVLRVLPYIVLDTSRATDASVALAGATLSVPTMQHSSNSREIRVKYSGQKGFVIMTLYTSGGVWSNYWAEVWLA
jgi:hypothetical protein